MKIGDGRSWKRRGFDRGRRSKGREAYAAIAPAFSAQQLLKQLQEERASNTVRDNIAGDEHCLSSIVLGKPAVII